MEKSNYKFIQEYIAGEYLNLDKFIDDKKEIQELCNKIICDNHQINIINIFTSIIEIVLDAQRINEGRIITILEFSKEIILMIKNNNFFDSDKIKEDIIMCLIKKLSSININLNEYFSEYFVFNTNKCILI